MNLTPDQTNKLKAAVKAKLIESGEYIDEELTEYVMIMVANKKTQEQMANDLDFLLGGIEKSTTFAAWLFQTLKNFSNEASTPSSPSVSSVNSQNLFKKQISTSSSKSAKKSTTSHGATMANDSTDELAIQIETNEFNEDFTSISEDSPQKQHVRQPTTTVNIADEQRKSDNNEDRNFSQSQSNHSQINSSTGALTTTSKKISLKPTSNVETSSQLGKPILSCVGAVINRKEIAETSTRSDRRHTRQDEADDDDFDKSKRRSSGVSSVIKVSERKYNVPKSLQPNKTILIRAVDDANKSVVTGNRSEKAPRSIADEKLELIRARRRREHTTTTEDVRRRLNQDQENRSKRQRTSSIDKRRVELENRLTFPTSQQNKPSIDERRVTTTTQSPPQQEPKFFVTLTGLNEDKFKNRLDFSSVNKTANKRTISDTESIGDDELIYEEPGDDLDMMGDEQPAVQNSAVFLDNDGDDTMQEELGMNEDSSSANQVKKKLIRCTFWPLCEKGEKCPYLHPNKQCTAFPNCTYGQMCHYIHPTCRYDGFCTKLDCPYVHYVKKPAPASVAVPMTGTEGAEPAANGQPGVNAAAAAMDDDQQKSVPKITINKIQSYYAGGIQSAVGAASQTISQPVSQQLRPSGYYAKPAFPVQNYLGASQYTLINRTNTVPSIPIQCKYGNLCKNPKCMYMHTNLPQKSQLKWVAPSAQQASTMSATVSTNAIFNEQNEMNTTSSASQPNQCAIGQSNENME